MRLVFVFLYQHPHWKICWHVEGQCKNCMPGIQYEWNLELMRVLGNSLHVLSKCKKYFVVECHIELMWGHLKDGVAGEHGCWSEWNNNVGYSCWSETARRLKCTALYWRCVTLFFFGIRTDILGSLPAQWFRIWQAPSCIDYRFPPFTRSI